MWIDLQFRLKYFNYFTLYPCKWKEIVFFFFCTEEKNTIQHLNCIEQFSQKGEVELQITCMHIQRPMYRDLFIFSVCACVKRLFFPCFSAIRLTSLMFVKPNYHRHHLICGQFAVIIALNITHFTRVIPVQYDIFCTLLSNKILWNKIKANSITCNKKGYWGLW